MNRLNELMVWAGVASFVVFLVVLSFYVASILLPIILAIFIFTIVANGLIYLYKKYVINSSRKGNKCAKNDVIDVEYEIIEKKD